MFKKLASQFLKDATHEVSANEAPHLFDCIKKLEAKAAHPNAVFHRVHFINDTISDGNPMLGHLAGVFQDGKQNVLILGKDIRNLFGHTEATSEISKEFEAILAHELGHLRHGDMKTFGSTNTSLVSPLLGAMAAVGGIALARHLMQQYPQDPEKQKELLEQKQQDAQQMNGTVKAIATAGIYLAGVVLGAWGGLHGGKLLRHRMEYRADGFSAELTGTGEHLANALKTLRDKFGDLKEEIFGTMRSNGMDTSKQEKINKTIEDWLHPPIEERISRMEKFSR